MNPSSKSKGKPAMSLEAATSGIETAQKTYEKLFGSTKEQVEKHEGMMRVTANAALEWFKSDKEVLIKHVSDGGTYERYFVVVNDPVREAIAVKLASSLLKNSITVAPSLEAVGTEKKGGFFSKFFGKR